MAGTFPPGSPAKRAVFRARTAVRASERSREHGMRTDAPSVDREAQPGVSITPRKNAFAPTPPDTNP